MAQHQAMHFEAVKVRDGRIIAISEFGEPAGKPCLYFHGTGSSRLEARAYDSAAKKHGVRFIGLDRPGVGHSDPCPSRQLLDWADDVTDVAEALGIQRFAVAGMSGGGPHALACASRYPERVLMALVINTAMPANDPELMRSLNGQTRLLVALAGRAPWLLRSVILPLVSKSSSPDRLRQPRQRQALLRRMPTVDRELFSEPENFEAFIATMKEGGRQGPQGAFQDWVMIFARQGWGFDPLATSVPLEIFVGNEDASRLFDTRLSTAVPQAHIHWFPGGHYAFLAEPLLDKICATIAAA
ncbi:MAG: alpha/beta hydrolase [Ktedonobacteraceae bacterium]|nr:alpha/beta hydrolase [Ktedonobacteraceae bacterium]